jgi:hypothetical protein
MAKRDLPLQVDLTNGRPPEEFFVPLIPDRFGLEAWREDPGCFDLTIPHNSWCAITSLRMALLLENITAPSQEELFEDACNSLVYEWREDRGWIGAYYRPFTSFLSRHGFVGRFVQGLTSKHIAGALARGMYCILRVSPTIRFLNMTAPNTKVGHVVFCFGYSTNKQGRQFHIHNCAGFASLDSQIDFQVSEARMEQVFSGDATIFRRRSYR